jgi:hypothetical protein
VVEAALAAAGVERVCPEVLRRLDIVTVAAQVDAVYERLQPRPPSSVAPGLAARPRVGQD